jgi:hypothetical protein
MSRHWPFLWIVLLGMAGAFALACGSSSFTGAIPQHQIVSLSVTPAVADARDYPDGEVSFVATGTYESPPTTVSPLQAHRVVVDPLGGHPMDVSISNNGVTHCGAGALGTFMVGAWVLLFPGPPKAICNVVTVFGNPCGDSALGIAQLTCP